MSLVIFITSHGNPAPVTRLCKTLLSGSRTLQLVIHHAQGEMLNFGPPLGDEDRIHILSNPLSARWGDFSVTAAAIRGMRYCLQYLDFKWFLWISGQDYPVRPVWAIERELEQSPYDAYLYAFRHDAPDHWPQGEGFDRYFFRYHSIPTFPYWHRIPTACNTALRLAMGKFNHCQPYCRLKAKYRNLPTQIGVRRCNIPFNEDFACYGGYTWINCSRACVQYIVSFVDARPDVVSHYRRTRIPDESFFQSILCNSGRFRIAYNCKRWINWDRSKEHNTSPVAITNENLGEILSTDAWFARKFDPQTSLSILDHLDAHVL